MKKIIKTTYLFYLEDFLREGRRFPSTERMNGENFVPLYTERINKNITILGKPCQKHYLNAYKILNNIHMKKYTYQYKKISLAFFFHKTHADVHKTITKVDVCQKNYESKY